MVVFWKYCRSILTIFLDFSESTMGGLWEYSRTIWGFFLGFLGVFWEKSASIPSQRANLKNWRAFRQRGLT